MTAFILRYWQPLAAVLAAVLALAAWQADRAKQYRAGEAAAAAKISAELAKAAAKQQQQAAQASAQYQKTESARAAKERVQHVTVQKIIEKPVYVRDCVDDDGLRELTRAIGE